MSPDPRFTLVILAAQRAGQLDPLAEAAGVSHKCLVPIAGRPLILHVFEALRGVAGIAAIHVVIEPEAVAAVEAIVPQGLPPVRFVPSAANIADSVYAGAEGTDGPVVVTTADNVLLTGAAVARTAGRLAAGDDVVIAVAREADVRAAHPDGQRRFYKFADSGYSNCNLYGLSPAGLRTAEAFRGGGQFASNPMRIVKAFGLLNMLILRFGLVDLAAAMRRLSRRFGVTVNALVLDDGAHAIDVDNRRTFGVAEELLAKRETPQ